MISAKPRPASSRQYVMDDVFVGMAMSESGELMNNYKMMQGKPAMMQPQTLVRTVRTNRTCCH
jgi:hypothetical protein